MKIKTENNVAKVKITKKVISLLLILLMLLQIFEPVAFAVDDENTKLIYGDWEYIISNNEVSITKYLGEDTEVYIPETINSCKVTHIGEDAFRENEKLTNIIIPNSVTRISYSAFLGCENLKDLTIPSSVKIIDNGAFYSCRGLTNVTISEGVTSIGDSVFSFCDNLTKVTIPDSLTSIARGTFSGCERLTSIEVKNSKTFSSDDGVLYNKEKTELIAYPGGRTNTTFNIPNGVKSIREDAFAHCQTITNVTIPEGVTSIGSSAFMGCKNLISVEVPNSVKEMSMQAFSYCEKLKNVRIPDGVTSIGHGTFRDCKSLTQITIPDSVTIIASRAFQGCGNIDKIVVPECVTTIGEFAFWGCPGLTSIKIPEGVTSIEPGTFEGCFYLTEITIPNSVTRISDSAFEVFWEIPKIIYGYKNSYAEKYANKWGIKFIAIEETEDETICGSFKCVNQEFNGAKGFKYSDNFFNGNATTYNHHLATMSLCLAYSAYNTNLDPFDTDGEYNNANTDANVKELLTKCGFSNYKSYNYDVKPTMDNVACAIASKQLDSGETLIAIAVRGGGYESEWGSNFNVGDVGDHDGFEGAANIVYERLQQYLNDRTINASEENPEIKGEIKIWMTGFSRAGATANLCAAKLSTKGASKELSRGVYNEVSFDNNDIYAYCFATPAGADTTQNSKPNSSQYNNIFSIVHYFDLVPLVAPAYWNFDRYGRTYIFPFRESLTEASTYEKNMLKRLSTEQRAEYEMMNSSVDMIHANLGSFLRSTIKELKYIFTMETSGMNFPIASRKQFISSGLENTMREAFASVYGTSSEKVSPIDIILNLIELTPSIIMQSSLHKHTIETALAYRHYLFLVHAEQDYYLAWMQSMDSNYVSGAKYKFTDGSGRLLYINCPVDVFVYNSSNNLVASIVDDVPNNIEITTFVDKDGQKLVYLPKDEDYTIKIIARKDCKTTITIDEYTGVSSDISKIISYSEIEMKKDEEVIATATKYNENYNNEDESGAFYTLKISDEEIIPNISVSGSVVQDYTYVITTECDEEQGEVTGGGVYHIGNFCQVTATSKPEYVFDGWYIDDYKVSDEETYRFAVDGNTLVVAKFIKCEHEDKDKTFINITPATLTKNGTITYQCLKCKKESNEIIYSPETILLSEDTYTYDGTEKTPIVTVIDCNGNVIDEGNYTLEYSGNRINAGDYTVKITFEGNYEGTTTENFTINRKEITPTINDIPNQTYTSGKIEPEVIMKDGETVLIKDVDYALEYKNNIDVGTATITYYSIDKSNYDIGTGEVTFTIEPYTLFTPNVSLESTSYRVTREEIKPEVKVTANGHILEKNVDYEIRYRNNIDICKNAEVMVIGKGNYDGMAIAFFKIVPKDVLTITGISNDQKIEYTGSKVELEGKATINSDLIPEDVELEVTWYNILGRKIETPRDVGNYYCLYKYEDANYVASLIVNVEITKAQSIPDTTHFEGTVGDKLNSIKLPEGMYWVNDSEELSLGKDTYLATFTQNNDTKNFTTENVNVNVYVKNKVEVAATTEYDNEEATSKIEDTTKSPQTGDNIVLWLGIMVVAIIVFVGITIYTKQKKNKR